MNKELLELETKMINSCQSGSKKSWRKYGKKVYTLRKELNLPISQWMEEVFGRITKL